MKFSGAMIGSDNPDGLGAFYTQVLGEPGFHDGEWYGWFQLGQLMIGPHSEVHGRNDRPERLMLMLEVRRRKGVLRRDRCVRSADHRGALPARRRGRLARDGRRSRRQLRAAR